MFAQTLLPLKGICNLHCIVKKDKWENLKNIILSFVLECNKKHENTFCADKKNQILFDVIPKQKSKINNKFYL